MYELYETELFTKLKNKYLSKSEIEEYNTKKEKLRIFPYGDILRVNYLKEFRVGKNKRIYYLLFEKKLTILFLNISNKKTQNKIISEIFKNMEYYKKYFDN